VAEWVWSIGGMILTGETEVLGEKHYIASVVDVWMSMEHWWNDTDRGNWSTGRQFSPCATSCCRNLTWSGPGWNSGLHSERPSTKPLYRDLAAVSWPSRCSVLLCTLWYSARSDQRYKKHLLCLQSQQCSRIVFMLHCISSLLYIRTASDPNHSLLYAVTTLSNGMLQHNYLLAVCSNTNCWRLFR
jgi:hypothetical protein